MDYKAKYKEALERAKMSYHTGVYDRDTLEMLEIIFPELKESEDEKIRESLISYLHGLGEFDYPDKKTYNNWLAWLEKQGNLADKVEPLQIKGGNWYVCIKDYQFCEHDYITFKKGKFYKSVKDGEIIAEDGGKWPFGDAKDFFRIASQEEINSMIKSADKAKAEHLIPQKGMYYTCIKDYYSSDNTHLCVKRNIYKSFFNGYINDESYLGLSWTNSCVEKYFEPTKDEDWIVCEHDNVIGKPMQYKEFKKKVNQKFIENLKAQGLTPKLRLWNLQDAKDGDVLYSPCLKLLWIFKSKDTVYCGCNLNYNDGAFCGEGYFERPTDAIPAAKEQRDLLFQKMKEAGYEWDDDKKELKKISQRMVSAEAKEAMYDKPAWSEEDKVKINRIVACLENLNVADNDILLKDVDWLKSLKERIKG